MFDFEENLKKLPNSPGVYIHKDKLGQVIYVGKAISLRKRVRQYFRLPKNPDAKVAAMVSHIAEFEYITCATEMEALVLENNLIKKYMPKYNILLRDDKTYPYIKVTTKEDFPRIFKTRYFKQDGNRYFGPYSDVKAVDTVVELLNDRFLLKRCSAVRFPQDSRVCLNYHIQKCKGYCQTLSKMGNEVCLDDRVVDNRVKEKYLEGVQNALELLNGKGKKLVAELKSEMEGYAENLEFEKAKLCRDQILAINNINETQRATLLNVKDTDIVMAVRGEREHFVAVFFVRDGKLSGRETFSMQAEITDDSQRLVSEFIKQYYSGQPSIPHEILVAKELDDAALIEEYLTSIAGKSIRIYRAQKGDKKALLDLAIRDSIEMTKNIEEKHIREEERRRNLGTEVYEAFGKAYLNLEKKEEYRIESYDISNTNGVDTVGSMVVFLGLTPVKKDYRRFKVKTVIGQDDYKSLEEIVERRFKRAVEGDQGFKTLPDMIFADGGKGQITAVKKGLDKIGGEIAKIPVIGMAKDDRHRTRAAVIIQDGKYQEIELSSKPLLFRYFGTVQEEVHRFAIDYHNNLRGKNAFKSVLDEIEGIGEKKRNALLTYFKNVADIRKASKEELCQVNGITEKNAEAIISFFQTSNQTQNEIIEK